jgi:hypothetical protein
MVDNCTRIYAPGRVYIRRAPKLRVRTAAVPVNVPVNQARERNARRVPGLGYHVLCGPRQACQDRAKLDHRQAMTFTRSMPVIKNNRHA